MFKVSNLSEMIGGWIIGDFTPSLMRSADFEIGIKFYAKGTKEDRHEHRVAKEITVIVEGVVKMNGETFREGDIIEIDPGISTDFEALEATKTVVVKTPSVPNDKYMVK